jgi:hypothetical protein
MTRIRTIAATVTLGAAAAFFVAGPYMVYRGVDARNQVAAELRSEHIITPDDASKPNVLVKDGPTAVVQAEIIKKHALAATDGKTYAQLDREDPRRQVALSGANLRAALMSSALAWETANLVIGLGAMLFGLAFVFLAIGLVIRKPEQVLLAAAPEVLREPVTS